MFLFTEGSTLGSIPASSKTAAMKVVYGKFMFSFASVNLFTGTDRAPAPKEA